MAISDGTVVWVGQDRPGRALHPDADVIDVGGAFVGPGFVDTHVHTTALGLTLTGLDVADAGSLRECLDLLRTHAAVHDDAVIWGQGWDDTDWPDADRGPTTAELDAAAPGRAVYLARIDAHSAACSTPLRVAAGSTGQHPVTADDHHRVRAAARDLLTVDQRARARTAALDRAAALGIVAVHECSGPHIAGRTDLAELLATEHGVQVRAYWGQAVADADEAAALLAETGAHALGGDLFVDGAIGSRTAWLSRPYADRPHLGTSYLDVDAVAAHVRACTLAGVQTGFHVIGDAAVAAVAAGIGRVVAELGGPAIAARGHRLEHVEMIDADHIAQFAAWGVMASVQPGFDAQWGGADGMYARALGRDRAAAMNPFAAMAAAGIGIAIGSDAPVTPLSPWDGLRAAVHHRTEGSGLSPRAAYAAATRGAWRAGGVRDGLAGTLVPGAPASYGVWDAGDLVVTAATDAVQRWSTDPRSRVPAMPRLDADAPNPVCLRTVHRGVTIYER